MAVYVVTGSKSHTPAAPGNLWLGKGKYSFEYLMMGFRGCRVWSRTGLPAKFHLQQEALNPDLRVPKVSIFINPLTIDVKQAQAIRKKFCGEGRVVVFMLAPGLAAPGDGSNPEKITGFKIQLDQRTINKPLIVGDPNRDRLLQGIRKGSLLCHWNEHMQWYANVSARLGGPGKVLACYAGTQIPGMLVDRKKEVERGLDWLSGRAYPGSGAKPGPRSRHDSDP
jgi:hypothetical protein